MALTGADSGVVFQVTGTFGSGTVYFEASVDSTNGVDGNWTTLSCRVLGTTGTSLGESTGLAGAFRGNTAGMSYVRLRMKGATAPSVACVIRATAGTGPVALNAPVPTGTNTIGAVKEPTHASATKSNYTITASNGTALAANTSRQFVTIWNDSTTTVYVDLTGGTASATSCTVKLLPDAYYEMNCPSVIYTGAITAIGASATGTLRITEYT